MKKQNAIILGTVIFSVLAIAGCDKKPGGSAATPPPPANAGTQEQTVYSGDLELSKVAPVQVTIEETNTCTITTMALAGGVLNLDIAIEPKGGTATHTSVTTHDGQQFTIHAGNTAATYTAKLKKE
jgi:hypothetical protein